MGRTRRFLCQLCIDDRLRRASDRAGVGGIESTPGCRSRNALGFFDRHSDAASASRKRSQCRFLVLGGRPALGFSLGLVVRAVLVDTIGWSKSTQYSDLIHNIKTKIDLVGAGLASAFMALLCYLLAILSANPSRIKSAGSIVILFLCPQGRELDIQCSMQMLRLILEGVTGIVHRMTDLRKDLLQEQAPRVVRIEHRGPNDVRIDHLEKDTIVELAIGTELSPELLRLGVRPSCVGRLVGDTGSNSIIDSSRERSAVALRALKRLGLGEVLRRRRAADLKIF
ncbi:hypothetical protein CFD26_106970 [Aspergillus turcosus]|uniref:Uncharacterized protein n=1 Tax=Aspergillus turcosus TaxID=1245748 RepID=A0A3R7JFZ0_9EURO|nr:hypothetical protein CFD26_106970 [Aspergillus turcosus]